MGLSATGTVLVLLLWFLSTETLGIVPTVIFPSPVTVWEIFNRIDQVIFDNLRPTLQAGLLGFLIALVLSTATAVVITMNERLEETLMPFLVGGNSIPRVAIAPLIIFYIDVLTFANLIIAAWIAFFPMFVNIAEGLDSVEDEQLQFFSLVGAGTWQQYRYLRFPNALPYVFDAMKIGTISAMVGAVVGEFVASKKGIGYLALLGLQGNNLPLAFAIVIVTGAITTVLLFVIYLMEARLMFWEETSIFTD